MTLDAEARAVLLRAARDALRAAVTDAAPHVDPRERTGPLAEPRACFVTLRVRADGALRGCIGTTSATRPLADEAREMAAAAALRDPRFSPVAPAELEGLHLDVSVLSPPAPLRAEDVVVGRHGLIVERRGRRGLLLPQVATDHGLDARRFLEATCEKAGLPADAWRDPGTQLYGFTADVYEE